jgi:hypothetical protein
MSCDLKYRKKKEKVIMDKRLMPIINKKVKRKSGSE